MICLRLPRHLARRLLAGLAAAAPSSAVSLPCALLLGLLVASGPSASAAGARSRARHITPALTPLHYTERSFSAPRHGKPTGKSPAKHAGAAASSAETHSTTASGARGAAKHAGKHADAAYEAPVPLLRTGRANRKGSGEGPGSRSHAHPPVHTAVLAPEPALQPRKGHRFPPPSSAPDPVVAEVTGHAVNGDTLARLHNRPPSLPGHNASTPAYAAGSVVVASNMRAPLTQERTPLTQERTPLTHENAPLTHENAPLTHNLDRRTAPSTQPALAHGALPSDDLDRSIASLPLRTPPGTPSRVSAGNAVAGPIATVTVQAPSDTRRPAPAPSQVVDGFGSELALAPALPSNTPGATRRRNHPIAAPAFSPISEDTRSSEPAVLAANLPSTLAERDAITAGAMTPSILSSPNLPNIYDLDGRLVVPAPLRGSREVLVHQNTMADNDGLERIQNDLQLNHLRSTGQLIDLPASVSLRLNDNLPYNRRSARPWTALFTQDIARDFYARFHQPLWVTSAVRTVAFQSRLIRVNGNAAGLSGDFASPHLTGQAVDFGKRGMSAAELAWMRSYLLPLIQSGKIDVEEEFQQACFHISVYRRYAGGRHLANPTLQVASGTPTPAYPPPPPRTVATRPITPLTNPEITDTDE